MYKIIPFFIALLLAAGCNKKDNVYDVKNITPHSMNAKKTKEKSDEQYIAVLHSDFFAQPASVSEVNSVTRVFQSIGDKNLAHELLVSSYMNQGGIQLPSNTAMRADITQFIKDTYKKFLVREPTVAELAYLKNYIENHPSVTPELVYVAFATSNEYKYY